MNTPPTEKKASDKTRLHTRNKHRERYDFEQLKAACPDLTPFVQLNKYNDASIDFAEPEAVKMLNRALLALHYDIGYWDIPQNYLCPPIPGRADYIHHIADVLGRKNRDVIPTGSQIMCLDIGVGANCVYPIIGHKEYGWSFIGSDIDTVALESANKIVDLNPFLKENVELRLQVEPEDIINGILKDDECVDLAICNPPFHGSLAEAKAGTLRKLNNLNPENKKITEAIMNFGGQNHELWCEGGEVQFVDDMIHQSRQFSNSCFLFSTLISKQNHIKGAYSALKKVRATNIHTVEMGQGNKTSRILAWSFLNQEQQNEWRNRRWKNNL
jgi:23S rRNA (adenine1618-N6)-methyltransferase